MPARPRGDVQARPPWPGRPSPSGSERPLTLADDSPGRARRRLRQHGPARDLSMTAVLNEPSQAVMRRLGLTETTRFDHPRIPPGDPLRPQVAFHGTP